MATVTHTFVSGIADDPTAAAAGEVLPSHWNANHTVSGVRTILTANTNFYVTTTGNDSNDGRTLGTAWATLPHAFSVLANFYDFGGQNVYLKIGAGTFAGAGTISCMTGGGQLVILGAGSANTTINCAGSPTGDGFDFNSQTSAVSFDRMTLGPSNFDQIGAFSPGVSISLFDNTGLTGAADIVFRPGNNAIVIMDAQSTLLIGNHGGSIVFDGTGQTSPAGFELSFQSCLQDLGQAYTFINNFKCGSLATAQAGGAGGLFTADFGGTIVVFGPPTFAGSATGQLYTGFLGANIELLGTPTPPVGMTLLGLDASGHGSIDGISGFDGVNAVAGAPTTAQMVSETESVFKDTNQATTTKGMALYGDDNGTIFPLTPVRTTFANLPGTPHQGDIASITDGLAANCADGTCTTFGTNVTGGTGALNLLIWYNGTHWTLMGK